VTPLSVWGKRAFLGGLAPVVLYGSRFAANIIMSRLLAPHEFGTAVAISVVLGIGGLATDVALDRFVMIDGSPRALSTANLLAALNGILLALGLVFAAPLTARLFGVPNLAGSFAIAASISAIGGFAHLGVKQIQRNYDYVPDTIAQVTSNFVGVLGLLTAAVSLRNHHAIIVGMGLQSAVYVILSHLLAPSSYKIGCNKEILFRALSFGLPLTLNGIGLAAISQLDRVVVGSWFGVKELGLYAVIFSMSVVPTNLIIGVFSRPSFSFLLSHDQDHFHQSDRYQLLLTFYSLVTGLYACWMVLTLDVLTPLIFGQSFTVSPLAHVLFVLIACLRLQRFGAPTSLLLASGRTKQLAVLNLSAGFGLVMASAGISVLPTLEAMLGGIAIGEFASCTLFFTTLGRSISQGRHALSDLVRAVAVPTLMAAELALNPYPTLGARGMLLLTGILAVLIQLALELFRSRKLRAIVAQFPIGRGLRYCLRTEASSE
jgi:O-antigen/teichoic acid export membrane protein